MQCRDLCRKSASVLPRNNLHTTSRSLREQRRARTLRLGTNTQNHSLQDEIAVEGVVIAKLVKPDDPWHVARAGQACQLVVTCNRAL